MITVFIIKITHRMKFRKEHKFSCPFLLESGHVTLPADLCWHSRKLLSFSVQRFYGVSLDMVGHAGNIGYMIELNLLPPLLPSWRSGSWTPITWLIFLVTGLRSEAVRRYWPWAPSLAYRDTPCHSGNAQGLWNCSKYWTQWPDTFF